MITESLIKIFQYIDTYPERFIEDLKEAVAFQSVSGSYKHSNNLLKMIRWTEAWLKKLNAKYECFDIGSYEVDGKMMKLPLVILATFGKDPKKKTVCAYCRVDVRDADKSQWKTDPWVLTEKNRRLYGRGTCKGKGPLLSWFHCIEAFMKQGFQLPVNLKLIIEGMFEMSSFGMENFLYTQRLKFVRDIDFVCLSESEWLNTTVPCISYGTVGICQYEITCASSNSSSKVKPEEMLKFIHSNCVDALNNILIPNFNNDVLQTTPDAEMSYDRIRCDLTLIKQNLPEYMRNWDKRKILMHIWRSPSFLVNEPKEVDCTCINDSSGGDYVSGGSGGGGGGDFKKGFSQRYIVKIVPSQTPNRSNELLFHHIKNLCENKFPKDTYTIESKVAKNNKKITCRVINKSSKKAEFLINCINKSASRPWSENFTSPIFEAAGKSVLDVYKEEANFIREGTDLPIVLILQKIIQKNIVLFSLSNNEMDDNFANECVIKKNYIEGKKFLASYLFEIANIKK